MGGSGIISVFVMYLVVLAGGMANGTLISTSRGLVVNGQLCCTQDGNCPGTGVPGAVVTVRCSTLLIFTTVVGQNTTDANGMFSITAPTATGSIVGVPSSIPCIANVQLPLNATVCPVLANSNGVLTGILATNGTVVNPVIGIIQAARLTFFVRWG